MIFEIHGSLIDLINLVVQYELHILAQGKPGQRLRVLLEEIEILLGLELDAYVFGISLLLRLAINPLRSVLIEGAPADVAALLGVLLRGVRVAGAKVAVYVILVGGTVIVYRLLVLPSFQLVNNQLFDAVAVNRMLLPTK